MIASPVADEDARGGFGVEGVGRWLKRPRADVA